MTQMNTDKTKEYKRKLFQFVCVHLCHSVAKRLLIRKHCLCSIGSHISRFPPSPERYGAAGKLSSSPLLSQFVPGQSGSKRFSGSVRVNSLGAAYRGLIWSWPARLRKAMARQARLRCASAVAKAVARQVRRRKAMARQDVAASRTWSKLFLRKLRVNADKCG
jgi:hypothetical protein